nr:MAG TPA: hypothetical protein [Caudoviricetes sp.]
MIHFWSRWPIGGPQGAGPRKETLWGRTIPQLTTRG